MTSHTRRKISASRSEAETRPLAATEPIRTERSAGEKEPATALSGAGFASFWLGQARYLALLRSLYFSEMPVLPHGVAERRMA
jgi:hypothetical protein